MMHFGKENRQTEQKPGNNAFNEKAFFNDYQTEQQSNYKTKYDEEGKESQQEYNSNTITVNKFTISEANGDFLDP